MVHTLSNAFSGASPRRSLHFGAILAALATLTAILAGCGGSGMPVPEQGIVTTSAITREEPTPTPSPSPSPSQAGYPAETDH